MKTKKQRGEGGSNYMYDVLKLIPNMLNLMYLQWYY
jgi:hypothetical protein